MQIEDIISQTANIIRKHLPKHYKVLLFGSWAKGNALENSDVDIAIWGDHKVKWKIMSLILSEIENIPTLRSIDIVDLNNTSKDFKESVLKTSRLLS